MSWDWTPQDALDGLSADAKHVLLGGLRLPFKRAQAARRELRGSPPLIHAENEWPTTAGETVRELLLLEHE